VRAPVHAGKEFSFPLGLRSNAPATVAISRAIMSVAAPGSGKVPARLGLALFRTVARGSDHSTKGKQEQLPGYTE